MYYIPKTVYWILEQNIIPSTFNLPVNSALTQTSHQQYTITICLIIMNLTLISVLNHIQFYPKLYPRTLRNPVSYPTGLSTTNISCMEIYMLKPSIYNFLVTFIFALLLPGISLPAMHIGGLVFHVPSSWQVMVADPTSMYSNRHANVTFFPAGCWRSSPVMYVPFSGGLIPGHNADVKFII